jgi:hypothetical protein
MSESTALATRNNYIANAGDDAPAATGPVKGTASYLSFVWSKTQNDDLKARIVALGGVLPTFVLTRAGFQSPIKPFNYHLLKAVTIATQMDESGKIVDAEEKMPEDGQNNKWSEHTFAVVLAEQGESLVPALAQLRGGARKALTNAETATRDAGVPGWERKGTMFKAAAEATEALSGRIFATGSVLPEKSPKTGRMMLTGRCSWLPSTKAQAERFNAAIADPAFMADVAATFNALDWKLKSLLSKQMDAAADE